MRGTLQDVGIPVFVSKVEMLRFLDSLPPVEGKAWEEAFIATKRYREVSAATGAPSIEPVDSIDDLRAQWADHAEAILCGTSQAVVQFDLSPAEHPVVHEPRPEIAALGAADALESISEARDIARHKVIGQSRAKVWTQRVAPAARDWRQLRILDPYAVIEAARKIARGSEPNTGLKWFLDQAAPSGASGQMSLRLYTRMRDREHDQGALTAALSALFPEAVLRHYRLVQVWGWYDTNLAHQRFVEFDGLGIRLGNGTSLFENDPISTDEICAPYGTGAEHVLRTFERNAYTRFEWRSRADPLYWRRYSRHNGDLSEDGLIPISRST